MTIKSIEWNGKKITEPGCYKNIPMAIYHGDCCDGPSVSTTGLKKLFHQGADAFYDTSYLNPKRAEDDETSALIMGRAIHHLALGEPHFQKVFCEQPKTYEDEKTGEVKKWHGGAAPCIRWERARAKENRYILTGAEVESIRGIATSLSTHPLVQAGVLNGLVERSLFWRDPVTGIFLKHRPDVIPTDSGDICDLKKIREIDWDTLENNLFKFGYYQQGALSRWALKEVLDIDLQSFTLLFVCDKRPHSVRPVIVKENSLNLGMLANRAALDLMARCIKEDRWPGPGSLTGDVAEYIELKEYHRRRIITKLVLMGYKAELETMGFNTNE